MPRPLLPPAHAGVIFIYYLLWQQREWRGVGESVLSVLKCLTIWMKFSMWRTRGRPCVFFSFFFLYYLFPRRWWKDGEGRRDVQRERWSWQKERRPPNPPVYWSGLRPVCCGDRWGSEGGREGGAVTSSTWPPSVPPVGAKKIKKRRSTRVMKLAGCQSDRRDISGGDRSQTWRLPACQRRRHLLLLHLPSKSSILSNESVQSVKRSTGSISWYKTQQLDDGGVFLILNICWFQFLRAGYLY